MAVKKEREARRERRKASEIIGEVGKIGIAEEVIASIAGLAASEVEGLGKIKGGIAEGLAGIFAGRQRGVETELGEDSVKFSLKVGVQYGQPIHKVAQEIQRSVIKGVEEMTGLKVSGVDVYVQELQFPEEAETEVAEEELYDRALKIIEDHPEGIRLADIGKLLSVDWRILIAPVNRLIEEGEVRKEDKEYFPVE